MYKYYIKNIEKDWWVVAEGDGFKELKIAKVNNLKHPRAVATAIADSLNSNKKLILVDLL